MTTPTPRRFPRTTSGVDSAFRDAEYARAIHPPERRGWLSAWLARIVRAVVAMFH